MTKPLKPKPALPPQMTGTNPDSWAHDTICRRWPEILNRIFMENELPKTMVERLEAVGHDIPDTPISFIDDPGSPNVEQWNEYLKPYVGKTWLEPPWFLMEHYFYRRVMAAIGYYQSGQGCGLDPFSRQKRQGLEVATHTIEDWSTRLTTALESTAVDETLASLLYLDLWGNQADLSLWPAEGEEKPDHDGEDAAKSYLITDDAALAVRHILALNPEQARIDLLVDNAGVELFGDLLLADYLLTKKLVSVVCLHLKPHPTYVSDAMKKDVVETIAFLEAQPHGIVNAVGRRLREHQDNERLRLDENFYWTSPLAAWEMPDTLTQTLSESGLVISKGDAHYRRLLGDLDWPHTTPFTDIVCYYPAPLLALRTLKSELACGLMPGEAQRLSEKDPAWLTNGKWGLFQFAP